jgi:hypothetical protein
MITWLIIAAFLLSGFCNKLSAQTFLKGKIYEAGTDSLINDVTIFNSTAKLTVHSNPDGSYAIAAAEGDRIIFSAAGFMPDTLTVSYGMLFKQHDVTLFIKAINLKPVTVIGSYSADSLARRNYYRDIYKKQPGITGFNTPQYGAGVVLSPLSYFSAKSKKKRQLKNRLIKNEQEAYIDYSFPPEWIERLTGLHGDSLRLFMYSYRPSYSFCRKTSREDMVVYISDKVKEFRKPKVIH